MKQQQSIAIFIFVLLLSFNSVKSAFMLSFYAIDTKDFVELFCINKDKPKLACNGKCELSKLTESDTQNEKPNPLDFLQKELVFYWTEIPLTEFRVITPKNKIKNRYENLYHYLVRVEIYQPPIV